MIEIDGCQEAAAEDLRELAKLMREGQGVRATAREYLTKNTALLTTAEGLYDYLGIQGRELLARHFSGLSPAAIDDAFFRDEDSHLKLGKDKPITPEGLEKLATVLDYGKYIFPYVFGGGGVPLRMHPIREHLG